MRPDARKIFTGLLLLGCAAVAACGGDEKGGNTVQMKDLEVVDGTTTDAMTDLDGVQSEAPAPALAGNRADNAASAAPKEEAAGNASSSDTEVLSDQ